MTGRATGHNHDAGCPRCGRSPRISVCYMGRCQDPKKASSVLHPCPGCGKARSMSQAGDRLLDTCGATGCIAVVRTATRRKNVARYGTGKRGTIRNPPVNRVCRACGTPLVRKTFRRQGKKQLEGVSQFENRSNCDKVCGGYQGPEGQFDRQRRLVELGRQRGQKSIEKTTQHKTTLRLGLFKRLWWVLTGRL